VSGRKGCLLIAAAALVWLAGCATTPAPAPAAHTPPPAAGAPPAHAGTPVGTTASGGSISVNVPDSLAAAVVDSTPSADALAVLGTIPDPLGRPTSENAAAPVPAPTPVLGDRPPATASPDAGTASGGAAAGGAAAGGAAAGGAAAGAGAPAATKSAASDSCWRVQVLAPPEKEHADRMAEAAQSQLGVPFVVEKEGGLYKVRTRDCLTPNASQALKNRAIADGFDGSFRFLKPR
jgi:hypothetical protein